MRSAVDLKLLPVEEARQSVRFLKGEVDQGSALQAHGLAVGGVVDRPAGRLRPHVMPQPRSGCDRWREVLTHAVKTPSGRGIFAAEARRSTLARGHGEQIDTADGLRVDTPAQRKRAWAAEGQGAGRAVLQPEAIIGTYRLVD